MAALRSLLGIPPSRPPPRRRDGEGNGDPHGPHDPIVAGPGRLPAAAAPAPGDARGTQAVFALTLLSAADGSLLAIAAAGQLESLGGALSVGLLVIAGAGSWLAARSAFGGRQRRGRDWAVLAVLGLLTVASTAAAAWLGTSLAQAVTLHVLPKAAGVVALLVAAEVAGLRLPRLAGGRLPLPFVALAAGALLEVVAWTA